MILEIDQHHYTEKVTDWGVLPSRFSFLVMRLGVEHSSSWLCRVPALTSACVASIHASIKRQRSQSQEHKNV